ncbi:hypothetical protein [Methylobacterium nigriterrae]|uniref:hypothetical protein n=1 Tax=Methylobacterium nigriterrae TaxID=3127512 RepID=UPI003013EAF6
MTPRLQVIEGGLADAGAVLPDRGPLDWTIGLEAADEVDADAVAAWRALLTRSAVSEPHFTDPDYLLTAARHQAAGQRLAFAWARHTARPETLHGVVPLVLPRARWGRRQAAPWQAPGLAGASPHLIEARYAVEIRTSLRERLAADRYDLAPFEASPTPPTRRPILQLVRGRAAAPARTIPAGNMIGIRGERRAPGGTERVTEPRRIRDAVETFLLLDAKASRRPIVADPSEAAMVRVVTRLFARRRQASVEIERIRGEVVSGRLRLGADQDAVVWRQATLEGLR